MATVSAYNGVREKEVNQINTSDGKACVAYSAPDFFLKGQNLFSPKRSGNQVKFFTTGEDYFRNLATAIDQATQTIFITGWQVNYDVLLDGKRSLWQCLHRALKANPALKVYVMPWKSPTSSLGTYDFETMLAIFHLNAGLKGGPRAFCTPATQQSDMAGLGVAFSHHQKSVVIDNRIGYVGGIDLAYGRRDDNNFSLDASQRKGNDAYNPGLPKLGWMAIDEHVSRMGLMMATLLDLSRPVAGVTLPQLPLPGGAQFPEQALSLSISRGQLVNSAAYVSDLFSSPPMPALEWMGRAYNSARASVDERVTALNSAKWQLTEKTIRAIATLIRDNLDTMPMEVTLKQRITSWLEKLEASGGSFTASLRIQSIELVSQWMSTTELGRVLSLLSGKSPEDLPAGLVQHANELVDSVFWLLHGLLQDRAGEHQSPFPYLHDTPQPLASPDNGRLADDQPRMPWQDVHCRIEGPSVYDLSRNFIERWNGLQAAIADTPALQETTAVSKLLQTVMQWLHGMAREAGLAHYLSADNRLTLDFPRPKPVWINTPEQLPKPPAPTPGGVSVQVLRSASAFMTQQEAIGRAQSGSQLPLPPGIASAGKQDNCQQAMLQAISSAQQFIYIENQFFQTCFGSEAELPEGDQVSGPMASLRKPDSLRQDFVARVRLREAMAAKDIWQLDWAEIDRIAQDYGQEARQFLKSMLAIWGVNAQGWLTHQLGPAQDGLYNTIGAALASRIDRAINEDKPFHVYLVLPVHPEGALNTPNIMHQVHLTMQSLVFGENSLVKRIQRSMALRELRLRKVSEEDALQIIERKDGDDRRVYQQQDWTRYLTLLNLRTWAQLDGRVVTEQIYVHSKLLIADDRVAILGSANINDRSLQGERDSELAVIVRDSTPVQVKLDGKCPQTVSKAVHELRVALWKKHFALGLTASSWVKPATELSVCLEQPAAETTWRAIQSRSKKNAFIYEQAFDFIPQNISQIQPRQTPLIPPYEDGFPTSIWPTWAYHDLQLLRKGGKLLEPLPHEEGFWQSETLAEVRRFAPPLGVQGFITALPINWTRGENNDSGFNKTVIADAGEPPVRPEEQRAST